MVVETVVERERTSQAVLDALQKVASGRAYANEIAESLQSAGFAFEKTLWTVWRLIDENRLHLDDSGLLVISEPAQGE